MKKAAVAAVLLALVAWGTGRPSTEVVATKHFEFHSDPWVNVHHLLYQWSRADLGIGTGRQHVSVPERTTSLEGDAAEEWENAVAFYREHLAERGHFDNDLLNLKTALLELGGDTDAEPPGAVPGHAEHLARAIAVYMDTWWEDHDRSNRRWIDSVVDRIRTWEDEWVDTASRVFDGEWRDGRLRVDASSYANWAGGYTSLRPDHVVIWSQDENNYRGLYGFELVLHESAHQASLSDPSRERLERIFGDVGADEPGNLWHALIFGTAGWFAERVSAEEGLGEHVPYIVAQGIAGFGGWREFWPAVAEHWPDAVAGSTDADDAVRAMAEDLGGRSR